MCPKRASRRTKPGGDQVDIPFLGARPLDFCICLPNLVPCSHLTKPLLNQWILVKRQASEIVLAHPWLKMVVYHCDLARQHATTITLLKLAFEYLIAPISLLQVSIQGIFILVRMIMPSKQSQYQYITSRSRGDSPKPIRLTRHGS